MKYTDTTYMLLFFRKRYFVSEYTPIDSNIAFPAFVRDKGRHAHTYRVRVMLAWVFISPTHVYAPVLGEALRVLRTQL